MAVAFADQFGLAQFCGFRPVEVGLGLSRLALDRTGFSECLGFAVIGAGRRTIALAFVRLGRRPVFFPLGLDPMIEVATGLTIATFGLLGMKHDWAPDEDDGGDEDRDGGEENGGADSKGQS